MNIWVIADTHFNHKNITNLDNRPVDYKEQIVANWSRLVADTDIVIHLGDVIFSRQSELENILATLPGYKVLTRGNHDHAKDAWYHRAGFSVVTQSYRLGQLLFSHEPQCPLREDIRLNLHGHFHNDDHRREEYEDNEYYLNNQGRYKLVVPTVEPVLLSTLTSVLALLV